MRWGNTVMAKQATGVTERMPEGDGDQADQCTQGGDVIQPGMSGNRLHGGQRRTSVRARVGPDAEDTAVRSLRDDLASGRPNTTATPSNLEEAELGLRLPIA